MKAKLEQELKDLEQAYKKGHLTTNEYCETYHAISQQIKKVQNNN